MVVGPIANIGVISRPVGRLDSQGRVINDSYDDEAFRGAYTGGNLTYKGFARPGAVEGDPVWQVSFLQYDGDNNVISITWPEDNNGNASNDYLFSWTDRTTYTYA